MLRHAGESEMKTILIVLYVTGFIVTFGHAQAFAPPPFDLDENSVRRGARALMSAAIFPLYWSIQIWESAK